MEMSGPQGEVFTTERLLVRVAVPGDAEMYFELWTDPRVMANVGFPDGLGITRDEILDRLRGQGGEVFERLLVVQEVSSGEMIGECRLYGPGKNGVARTDVKLLPAFQGRGFGTEVKKGLLAYLFARTDCTAVEASPNRDNTASIRMQEAVGGRFVREEIYEFPEDMRDFTTPVHSLIYHVSREDWEARGS